MTLTTQTRVQDMLATLRQQGWTLAAIAKELGVSRSSVDRWQAGAIIPRHGRMVRSALEGLQGVDPPARTYNRRQE